MAGIVYFIGAGPGDPELLTLKAHRLLQAADVILYDSLVGEGLIESFPARAERIPCGKRVLPAAERQETINRWMVAAARQGKQVVRLKGGDPCLFGRLAEEIEALQHYGVAFEVVPGVSSATAAAAALGLSLTHRELAEGVTMLSAHPAADKQNRSAAWGGLVDTHRTLVLFMGVARLKPIVCTLRSRGMSAETPVAIVERASQPDQRITLGTLATIADEAKRRNVRTPAIIVVGQVVAALDRPPAAESFCEHSVGGALLPADEGGRVVAGE